MMQFGIFESVRLGVLVALSIFGLNLAVQGHPLGFIVTTLVGVYIGVLWYRSGKSGSNHSQDDERV